jgi:F0F1-type ATP synthase membrane subunit b/b'
MFLSLDGTFWIQLVNFAIFFAILNVVFLRPVGEAIKKRRAYIEGVHADYERYAHQIATFKAEAEQKRGAARRDAEELVAKTRAAAEAEAGAYLAEKAAAAQATIDAARATVASELAAAKGREDELSRQLARTLLERAIGAER